MRLWLKMSDGYVRGARKWNDIFPIEEHLPRIVDGMYGTCPQVPWALVFSWWEHKRLQEILDAEERTSYTACAKHLREQMRDTDLRIGKLVVNRFMALAVSCRINS